MIQPSREMYAHLLIYTANLYARQQTSSEIKADLKQKGLSEELSVALTEQGYQVYADEVKKRVTKHMLWGGVILIAGLLVAIATYSSSGGSRYIFAYGAISGGLYYVIRGLIEYSKL